MKPRRAQEDHTSPAFTETVDGLAPAFGSSNGYYLRDDGVWAPAPGKFDWIPDVERRDAYSLGNSSIVYRGVSGYVGGSGNVGAAYQDPAESDIRRVPTITISHTLVGVGTKWTGWSAARPGMLSTHRGFWAQWLFGPVGEASGTSRAWWTGVKDSDGVSVSYSCRMAGVHKPSGSSTIQWASAPSSTGVVSTVQADDIVLASTGWTHVVGETYRLTLTCPEGGDITGTLLRYSDGAEVTNTFSAADAPVGFPLGPWMMSDATGTGQSFRMANVRTRTGLADGLS